MFIYSFCKPEILQSNMLISIMFSQVSTGFSKGFSTWYYTWYTVYNGIAISQNRVARVTCLYFSVFIFRFCLSTLSIIGGSQVYIQHYLFTRSVFIICARVFQVVCVECVWVEYLCAPGNDLELVEIVSVLWY